MTPEPRALCHRCRRPQSACLCHRIAALDSRTRICFLQHPREARVAIGTARMAHLALTNSELHQGIDFAEHARVRELIGLEGTALLFPGEGAALPERPPRTLVVLDGTWSQARKLLWQNPALQRLPRIGFTPARPGNYRIRREPAEDFVSTIEAVAHVLGVLEGAAEGFAPLLSLFDAMVDRQLECKASRSGPPRRLEHRTARRPRVDGAEIELRARPGDVVAIYAESTPRDELVLLAAVRPATGDRFEAIVRPRELASARCLDLAEARLLGGETLETALARFAAFVREGDLFCGFGTWAIELLRLCGGTLRPFSDLRVVAARKLRRRPGGVEQAVRMLGRATLPLPLGEGRAGRRLAGLGALVGLLCGNG